MNGKGKKKTKKDPLEVKQPNGNTRPSTNKKSAPFHASERAFFSGRAFFMSMLVGFFVVVVVLQQPPHNSSDSGCLFSTDPKTDIRTDNRGKIRLVIMSLIPTYTVLLCPPSCTGQVSCSVVWNFK